MDAQQVESGLQPLQLASQDFFSKGTYIFVKQFKSILRDRKVKLLFLRIGIYFISFFICEEPKDRFVEI